MSQTLHWAACDTDIGIAGHSLLLRYGRLALTAEQPDCPKKEIGTYDWQRRPTSLGPDGSNMSHAPEGKDGYDF